jgi:hypothetical protein
MDRFSAYFCRPTHRHETKRREVSGGGDASLLAPASAWSWIEARLMGSAITIANFDMSEAQQQLQQAKGQLDLAKR